MRWLVLMCALVAVPAVAEETMRISMGEAGSSATVEGQGLLLGPDTEDGAFSPVSGARAEVRLSRGRIEVNGALAPEGVARFRVGTGVLHAGTWQVRGDVVVRAHGTHLELINVLPLEDYVAAVLGGEMPVSFPLDALKAQAVAARTYAVRRKIETLDQPYHLGSGVLAQVYGGVHREDARTRAATEATRGEILTYELAPAEAYFHSSCGGRTESGLAALNRDLPYLKSVDCPCAHAAATHWSLKLTEHDLENDFHQRGGLSVESRSTTGRARRVHVGERSVDAVSFRERVGYDKVKSLAFDVVKTGNGFLLSGKGYGHGAGLCQWGAKAFADQGWDYRRILEHYYPGTEIQRLY
jgi:stage II sporulation protein D